jgi:hypothetical protein
MELSRRFGVDNLVRQSGSNRIPPSVAGQGPVARKAIVWERAGSMEELAMVRLVL